MTQLGAGLAATGFAMGVASLVLGWIPVVGPIFMSFALGIGLAGVMNCRSERQSRGLAVKGFIMSTIAFSVFVIMVMAFGKAPFA